ncbi:MAG: circularly permuted type 2 ATP-grasp protein [Xanthobacteraceae bacterium]
MAIQVDAVEPKNSGLEPLVSGYRPLPGGFDEMMDADGRVRAHWQPFLAMLGALGGDEINRRFGAADRYLHDSGVFYRVYEDAAGIERPWPLSHVPLIVEPGEWRQLVAGLLQRAQLLEAVLGDSYGPGTLTRDGRLPAAVIAGNPEFLRPLVGVAPPGGAHLRFYAVDVGRGADGRWWVLSDRSQAPSGAGYAIENRLALSRSIPDIYRTTRVERVAPFFQALQAEIFALSHRDDARACLLTPGPMNETYFEHAYLARYLGLLLVEGEDLSVEDDGVFIRTVSGLRRTEVMLRRIDADFADPLELNAASRLGAAGLLQAVRDGKITIINSLGAGLIEARAMLAFLPALAPVVLGAELKLPNVATWWLGSAAMREEMLGKLDTMVIAAAFTEHLSDPHVGGASSGSEILGAKLDDSQRAALMQAIRERGIDYVAQEAVTLSSMPVWRGGRLQPRPFTLRLFIAKVGDGWRVMPGGFVRIADNMDARAVSLQHGAATADAWVLARGPVAETTLLPTAEGMPVQRASGVLPSRAADNLYWVGRYVERAEATLRLVRAIVNRVADSAAAPVMARISSLLVAWSAAPSDVFQSPPTFTARAVLTRGDLDSALPRLAAAARSATSVIRDRFSPDAWRAISDLTDMIASPLPAGPAESAIAERAQAALRIISAFSGLAQENMTQLAGWRFLELGRRIERALLTCRLIRAFAAPDAPDGSLDLLLELADSQISYRQRYVMIAALAPVIDLVMLDPNNPRSVEFQLDRIETHLDALPKQSTEGRLSPAQQIAAGIATRLRTINANAIDSNLIIDIESSLMKLSDAIGASFLTSNERTEVTWEALA